MTVTQVIFRPHRIRLYAGIVAVLFVAAFVVVAIFLKDSDTDATFYTSDQIAMIGIGVVFALAALWTTWPRVRADNEMIEVRNLLGTRRFTWDLVRHVSFPDGAMFARLELPADEYVPVLAIQAIDRERAVDAMRELRRMHREGGSASS